MKQNDTIMFNFHIVIIFSPLKIHTYQRSIKWKKTTKHRYVLVQFISKYL